MVNKKKKINEEQLNKTKEEVVVNDKLCVFKNAIDKYIELLNSQMDSFPIVLNTLAINYTTCLRHFHDFIKDKKIQIIKDEENKRCTFKVPLEYGKEFEEVHKEMSRSRIALLLIPKNIVVAMVSLYDAYLTDLLECAYTIKPQLLNSCEKKFSFSDLIQFDNLDNFRKHVVEKDVESIIRESHAEQLNLLSKKFKVELTKDLPSYNDFIEITERRNLFVHTNGKVSSQYLQKCNGRPIDHKDMDVQLGEELIATPAYVEHCYNTLFEIGVKLGHVIWRKIENDLEKADDSLVEIGYDLIKSEKFSLACIITDFSCKPYVKHFNKVGEYVLCVNRALAYYLQGDRNKCEDIINEIDWSGAELKFRLAHKVLLEQYDDAIEIMKKIGKTDDMRLAYSTWPLFNKFRAIQGFKETYKNIYGLDFQYSEPQQTKWEDVIQEAMNLINESKEMISNTEDTTSSKELESKKIVKLKKKPKKRIE